MHNEFGVDLVSTADSHYPNPTAWKDRELYKRLGWLGKSKPAYESSELPIDVEEIGYELYPKNGDQMWESYEKYAADYEYDDDVGTQVDHELGIRLLTTALKVSFRTTLYDFLTSWYPQD